MQGDIRQSDIEFRFKGERQYVHGTDMFNQTLAWLQHSGVEPREIDFAFHRIGRRQLTLVPDDAAQAVEPVAVCSFQAEGARRRVALVERDAAVTGRYPYPEDEMVRPMQVDTAARRGVLAGEPPYTDIEVFVAMTKALHQQVFPELQGKWLFARARFPRYARHTPAARRSITILSSFNGKLTRSEAALDGVKVGEIFFALS